MNTKISFTVLSEVRNHQAICTELKTSDKTDKAINVVAGCLLEKVRYGLTRTVV